MDIVDRVDEWVAADAKWFDDNRPVLETAFDIFPDEGEWPQVGALRRLLHRRGVRDVDVQEIANAKPPIPAYSTPAIQDRIFLGVRHLLRIPKADPLLRLLVDVTNEGVLAYSGTDEQPSVHYDNPRFFKYDSNTLIRLVPLISSDYPNPFGGGNYGDEWVLFVNDALILDFEDVEGPLDYLQRQVAFIRKWVERASPPSEEDTESEGADKAERALNSQSSASTTTPPFAPFPFVDRATLLSDLNNAPGMAVEISAANPSWISAFVNAFTAEEERETTLAEQGKT